MKPNLPNLIRTAVRNALACSSDDDWLRCWKHGYDQAIALGKVMPSVQYTMPDYIGTLAREQAHAVLIAGIHAAAAKLKANEGKVPAQ